VTATCQTGWGKYGKIIANPKETIVSTRKSMANLGVSSSVFLLNLPIQFSEDICLTGESMVNNYQPAGTVDITVSSYLFPKPSLQLVDGLSALRGMACRSVC
jgi:hypothetical protein